MVKKNILFMVLLTLALPLVNAGIGDWVVNGDKVYVNDSQVYIEAPHIITSKGYVDFLLETKSYTGNVNLLFGFNSSEVTPSKAEKQVIKTITYNHSQRCPTEISGVWYNYTLNPNHVWCWQNNTNGTKLLWNTSFQTANSTIQTVYWTTQEQILTYEDVSSFFNTIQFDYDGKDTWYYVTNVPVTAGSPLVWRAMFEFAIGTQAKYDFAAYPSIYGTNIQQAINNGAFYLLDPWISSTDYEIGNVSNSSNTWETDINSTSSTVTLSSDNKTFTLGELASSSSDLTTGNTIYWTLDNVLTDAVDGDNTLSASGGSHGTGIINNGYTFASGNTLTTADHADMEHNRNQSINFWIKTTAAGSSISVMDRYTDVTNRVFSTYLTTGSVCTQWYDGSNNNFGHNVGNNCTYAINDDTWHMVTFATNGSHVWAYTDGVLTHTTATGYLGTGTIQSSDSVNWQIGGNSAVFSGNFVGSIDEVGFWQGITLSASQVSELYAAGMGNQYPYSNEYNASNNLYESEPISIARNAYYVNATWNYVSNGYAATLNFTCNADSASPTWTGSVTNNTLTACPVVGDSFKYQIHLTGDSTTTPVMQNLTASFITNTAPNLTNLTISPSSPYDYDDLNTTTNYSDGQNDSGTVDVNWKVNGVSVVNYSYSVLNPLGDASGNGNTLTNNGATYNSTAQAYNFDGTNDYLSKGNFPDLGDNGLITVCVWVKSNDSSVNREVINQYNTGTAYGFRIYTSTAGNMGFRLNPTGGGFPLEQNVFTYDDTWQHFCGTANGSVITTYNNAVANPTPLAYTGTFNSTVNTFYVGRFQTATNYWNGSIRDIRIWNRSLSSAEVAVVYANGSVTDGLVAWYPFTNSSSVNSYLSESYTSKDDNVSVCAIATDSEGATSSEVCSNNVSIAGIPSAAPDNLTSPSQTKTSIYVEWDNPSDVYWNYTELWIAGVNVHNTTSDTYNFTGLLDSTQYTISLYSVSDDGTRNSTAESISQNTTYNLAPSITPNFPLTTPYDLQENETYDFNITATDDDGGTLFVGWFKDGVLQLWETITSGLSSAWTWAVGYTDEGTYNITVEVNDSFNDTASYTWEVTVQDIYPVPALPLAVEPVSGQYEYSIPLYCRLGYVPVAPYHYEFVYSINGSSYEAMNINDTDGYLQFDISVDAYGSNYSFGCRVVSITGDGNYTYSENFTKVDKNNFYLFEPRGQNSYQSMIPYTLGYVMEAENTIGATIYSGFVDCNGNGMWDYTFDYSEDNATEARETFSCINAAGTIETTIGMVLYKNNTYDWRVLGCNGLRTSEEYCAVYKTYEVTVS